MQKATVTAAQPTGHWEGQYGVMYTFNVTLSDGTSGEVNSKKPQLRFGIGEEVEYTIPREGKLKLDRPNEGGFINSTPSAKPSYSGGKDYSKQHALNAACTFLNGSKATKEQVVALADYFATWLKGSAAPQVQQASPAETAPAPAPAAPSFESNGLPF